MSAPVLALLLSLFVGIATSAPTTGIQAQRLDETPQTVELDDDRKKMTPQKIDIMVSLLGRVDEFVPQEVKEFLSNMTDTDKAQLATFANDVQSGKFVVSGDQFTIEAQEALLKEKYPTVYVRVKKLLTQLQTKFGRLSQETKAFLLKPMKVLLDIAKQSDPEKAMLKVLDLYKEISANYASAAPIVRTDVEREWPELHRLFTSEEVRQKVRSMQQLIALEKMEESLVIQIQESRKRSQENYKAAMEVGLKWMEEYKKKQMEEGLKWMQENHKKLTEEELKRMEEYQKEEIQEIRKRSQKNYKAAMEVGLKWMEEYKKKQMEDFRLRLEMEA